GQCFFEIISGHIAHNDVVCQSLKRTARTLCQAVLNCESAGFGTCLNFFGGTGNHQPFPTSCYCSNATCSAGANGRCVAPINAFAGTTDLAVIVDEMDDSTSMLGQIYAEATTFATSGCGATCTGH
ncbi:MAG TPA: hypothetical protein VK989_01770, partial [Polyangia bacterium]|nr:hypothetical protein [Polyangia bacterium]